MIQEYVLYKGQWFPLLETRKTTVVITYSSPWIIYGHKEIPKFAIDGWKLA